MIVLKAGDPPAADRYREPPEEVVALVDAPPPPRVEASPDARWLLFVERASLPTIAELARPWLPLAGLRIDPQIGALWRASYDRSLKLVELGGDVASEPEESVEPAGTGAPAIGSATVLTSATRLRQPCEHRPGAQRAISGLHLRGA